MEDYKLAVEIKNKNYLKQQNVVG